MSSLDRSVSAMALSRRIVANLLAIRAQSALSGLTARSLFEQYGEPFNSFSVANDGLMVIIYDVLKIIRDGFGFMFIAINHPEQVSHYRPGKCRCPIVGE
jgi:hypothetical protein